MWMYEIVSYILYVTSEQSFGLLTTDIYFNFQTHYVILNKVKMFLYLYILKYMK